jgi:serine/threonine-protein kinase
MFDGGSMKPGDIVNGKYRIDSILGQGGFGVVLAATDLSLHREVAIKVLHPVLALDEDFKARFLREARATVQLRSEHCVRVHDVGQLDDASPYIVMERLVGQDLGAVLQNGGRVAVADALEYILQATEGLAEAHAAGIVHRDIKPGNLFLTQRPDQTPLIKVLDFGLAKASTSGGARRTRDSGVFGSPAYMSPEQLMGAADVDARADIWALGVSLYELVSGELPFAATSDAEVGVRVIRDAPVPPHERAPGIPVGLSTVILRCLEKEPSKRFTNVAELAAALEPLSTPQPSSVRERVGRVLSTPTSLRGLPTKTLPSMLAVNDTVTKTEVVVTTKPQPKRRRSFWAATGLALTGATLTAVLLLRGTARRHVHATVVASATPAAATLRTPMAASEAPPPASASATPAASAAAPSAIGERAPKPAPSVSTAATARPRPAPRPLPTPTSAPVGPARRAEPPPTDPAHRF